MHDREVCNKDKLPTRFQILKQRFQDFNNVRQKSKNYGEFKVIVNDFEDFRCHIP